MYPKINVTIVLIIAVIRLTLLSTGVIFLPLLFFLLLLISFSPGYDTDIIFTNRKTHEKIIAVKVENMDSNNDSNDD